MNSEELELSARLMDAITEFDQERPRSKQTSNFVVGLSELGFCSERTRRMLAGVVPEPTYHLSAFVGTAIGDYVEQAWCAKYPDAIRQAEVSTKLQGDGGRTYTLPGHPDLLVPSEGLVLDVKTTNGLEFPRRTGPSQQQQFQRHGYAYGAWQAGLFPDHELDDLRVANCWLDRSASEREVHVQLEPFSMAVVEDAARWLDEVVYSYLNGGGAMKEPPRALCEAACGHFRTCRMLDTDVEGLIDDPEQLVAVDMYKEGTDLLKQGRQLQERAKSALRGVEGSTGEWIVRWVHINESLVPETRRRGYDKIQLSRLK